MAYKESRGLNYNVCETTSFTCNNFEQRDPNCNACGTNSLRTDINKVQVDNCAMSFLMDELQSWVASGNQVPGNLSVSQGT